MRDQRYDDAATMRGQFRGIQASIKDKLLLASSTHCSSHSLNLYLSDASNIPFIRNCMGIIKEVCVFFYMSATRTEILLSTIYDCYPGGGKHCYVKRHDSVFLFKSILEPVFSLFCKEEKSSDSAPKAYALSNSISQFKFLVNLFLLSQMLSTIHNL